MNVLEETNKVLSERLLLQIGKTILGFEIEGDSPVFFNESKKGFSIKLVHHTRIGIIYCLISTSFDFIKQIFVTDCEIKFYEDNDEKEEPFFVEKHKPQLEKPISLTEVATTDIITFMQDFVNDSINSTCEKASITIDSSC